MRTSRRFLLAFALSLLGIALTVILFYAGEDWRGARAWAVVQEELRAKGESLNPSALIPAPVPDTQNLALAPFYVRAIPYQADPKTGFYTFSPTSAQPAELKNIPYGAPRPSALPSLVRDLPRRTDLAAYARYFRRTPGFPHADQPGDPAADVLLALSRYAPALDELAHAVAERPLTRFPVDWDARNPLLINLSHENLQQELVTTLALRASARLAEGQSTDALHDLVIGFRLCRDMAPEPALISHLVQFTCLRILANPVWEGLADRRWSSIELAHLQAELRRFDLLLDYRQAVRGERAIVVARGTDYLSAHSDELPAIISSVDGVAASEPLTSFYRWAGYFAPHGWFDANKAVQMRFMQRYCIEGVDPAAHRVFPGKFEAVPSAIAALPRGPNTLLARIGLPIYASVGRHAALVQAVLDQAEIACALERFFLDAPTLMPGVPSPRYPSALIELVPTFFDRLPTDLVDGGTLHYVQTPDSRYRLYEVGWNGTDDGGQIVWQKGGIHLDNKAGDWVWQYEPLSMSTSPQLN